MDDLTMTDWREYLRLALIAAGQDPDAQPGNIWTCYPLWRSTPRRYRPRCRYQVGRRRAARVTSNRQEIGQ